MQPSSQRIRLTMLALVPAGYALVIPWPHSWAWLASLLAAGSALGAWVGSFDLRTTALRDSDGDLILKPKGLQNLQGQFPKLQKMRDDITRISHYCPELLHPTAPPSRDEALCRILRRFQKSWDCANPDALSREEVTVLYALIRIVRGSEAEANTLAQQFKDPSKPLGVRWSIQEISRTYDQFKRDHRAFLATQLQFEHAEQGKTPRDLLSGLRGLKSKDIDLWHRVILEHDPKDPAQRDAALWCLQQPECDRASIAAYMGYVAADGTLRAAAKTRDQAYLDAITQILHNWNKGVYQTHEIALDPSDAMIREGERFAQCLDQVAAITGQPSLPMPRRMFTNYPGRPPKRRDHWCLHTGTVRQAPQLSEYIAASPRAYM
jgi:hypothetical protein